jgi:hypothetical protein
VLASGLLVLADWRSVFHPRRAWVLLRRHPVVAVSTLLLSLWVLIGAYSPSIPPLLRSLYQGWRGDLASSQVDSVGRYRLAEQAIPNFYWAYRREAEALSATDGDAARSLYAEVWELNPDDPYAMLGFADLAARNPDWELTPDERAWLSRDESEWRGNPWNSFSPTPTNEVDVGTGRDIPYILGFHRPDHEPAIDYRWSQGRSHIRIDPIAEGEDAPTVVVLRMSAPAIGSPEPMPVTVTINGIEKSLTVPVGWTNYSFPLPSASDTPVDITIESPIRDLSVLQPGSPDKRKLGVGLDKVTFSSTVP